MELLWVNLQLIQSFLADQIIAPLLRVLHLSAYTDPPGEIADFMLISCVQVAAIALLMRPLERVIPLEQQSARYTRIDRTYTLLKLLGLVPIFTYLILTPLSNWLDGNTPDTPAPLQLDRLIPWLQKHPDLLFLAYFALYDCTLYWIHRLQHAVPWWWMLHSLHHSQRQLNCWSNDRSSFLDDVLEAGGLKIVSAILGISGTDYAGAVHGGTL